MAVEKISELGLPKKDIPDSKKTEKYHLEWVKSIENLIKSSRSGMDDGMREWFSLMRMYGDGNQPQYLYRDYEFGKTSTPNTSDTSNSSYNVKGKGAREGEHHIDFDIVSIMPRIMDKLIGFMENVDYDVLIDTVDANSGAEKEKKKWRMWVQKEFADFIDEYKEKAGIPVQKLNFVPQSPYELELYEKVGGFKTRVAKAMEKLVQHTFKISQWDDETKEQFLRDLINTTYAVSKVELDPEDGKWKSKYIDLLNAIVPYVPHGDYTNMQYAGHYEQMSINDVRQYLPDVDEKKIAEMAKQYCERFGNPGVSRWDEVNRRRDDGSYGYDTFVVLVMHLEWQDEAQKKTMYYRNRYGKSSAFKLKDDEEPKEISDKQKDRGVEQYVDLTNYKVLRKASWIAGSDIIFNWGLANFMDRPIKSKVIPSYIVVRAGTKSITERLKPVMDDIMLSWIKYQDGRSMAVDAGYAIDFTKLQNIEDGGNKYSMLDVLQMWKEQRILLYQESLSGRYEGGAPTPVHMIPGIARELLEDAATMWSLAMQKIEDITGLSPVALGSMPTGETATGTELSMSATADILKPLIKKTLNIKERIAGAVMRRLQLFCKDDNIEVYKPVIGELDVKRLKEAEKTPVQYGMSFEAKPTDKEKQQLIDLVNISVNNRREGKPGLSLADASYVLEQINHGGNLKELRMIVSYQEEKARQEQERREKENIELQGKQNMALKQQEAQKEQQKQQYELAQIALKGDQDIEQVQAELMKEVLVDYMKDNPSEAKRFIQGGQQNQQEANNVPQSANNELSPESDSQVPLEGQGV